MRLTPEVESMMGVHTDREIAKVVHVSPSTVCHVRRKLGILSRGSFSRATLSRNAELFGTHTDAEIAALTGVTLGAIRGYRRRHGIARVRIARQKAPRDVRQPRVQIVRSARAYYRRGVLRPKMSCADMLDARVMSCVAVKGRCTALEVVDDIGRGKMAIVSSLSRLVAAGRARCVFGIYSPSPRVAPKWFDEEDDDEAPRRKNSHDR